MKIKKVILLLCLFIGNGAKCQTNLDSLLSIWHNEKANDSVRVEAYYQYLKEGFISDSPDSALSLVSDLETFAEENKYPRAFHTAQQIKGHCHIEKSNFSEAFNLLHPSLEFYEKIGSHHDVARVLHQIARVYYEQDNYPKALSYIERASQLYSDYGSEIENADLLYSIGAICFMNHQGKDGLKYIKTCLEIYKAQGYKLGVAKCLHTMGAFYADNGAPEKVMGLMQRSLAVFEEINSKTGAGGVHIFLGYFFTFQDRYDEAKQHLEEALEIFEQTGKKTRVADVYFRFGQLYNRQGQFRKALPFCEKAYQMTHELGDLWMEDRSCMCLISSSKGMGDFKNLSKYLELRLELINKLQGKQTAINLEQMKFEKKLRKDSLEQAELDRMNQEAHEAEIRKKNNFRNLIIVSVVLLLLLLWGLYGRWKKAIAERDLTEEKIDRVLQYEQLRKLDTIMEGQDIERKRIAEDLHDKLGGKFNALRYTWSTLFAEELESGSKHEDEIKALDGIIQSLSSEISDIIRDSGRSSAAEFGLIDSLEELRFLVQSSHKMEFNTLIHGIEGLDKKVTLELYKIILELVSNALKYSKGSHLNIHLNRLDNHVVLIVEDDGIGFNRSTIKPGMGLKNIQSRVKRLGGVVEIDSVPGRGTTVIAELDV